MSKRVAEEPPTGGLEPPAKKIVFEPLQLGSISNLEELDLKTLQFQNRKLGQRLNQKNRVEEQLRERIDQLEKRQTQDDAVINVINRYWIWNKLIFPSIYFIFSLPFSGTGTS